MQAFNRLVCLTVFSAVLTYAQHEKAGTTAFPFLKFDHNARVASMAGASVAVPNDLYGALINPSACGFIEKTEALFGYESLIADCFAGPLAYAMPYRNYGVVGAALYYVSPGYVDDRDENNVLTGLRTHEYSLAASVLWAKLLSPSFAVGASVKGINDYIGNSEIHSSAQAVAIDAGFQYRMLNSRLIVGAAVQNAGLMLSSYSREYEDLSLPIAITVGISYVPIHLSNIRLACDLQKANDDYLNYKPGFEAAVYEKNVFLRGGYSFSERDLEEVIRNFNNEPTANYMKSNLTGLSLGIGLKTNIQGVTTNVDIAYVDGIDSYFIVTILFNY